MFAICPAKGTHILNLNRKIIKSEKISLIMQNSNKKIHAKCSLTTYFLFFSHYRYS